VLFLGAFDRILAFIIFSAVLFLALTVATLFRAITPVRRWWYPAAPIFFVACCAALAFMLLMHQPIPAMVGAAVVLAGLPARALLVRASGDPPAASPILESET
jgi:basic amino acid/polyamine antiporter, APA family